MSDQLDKPVRFDKLGRRIAKRGMVWTLDDFLAVKPRLTAKQRRDQEAYLKGQRRIAATAKRTRKATVPPAQSAPNPPRQIEADHRMERIRAYLAQSGG